VHIFPANEISKLALPSIDLQSKQIRVQNDLGKVAPMTHYFFVDNKNDVQLLSPDYYSKSRRFEIINQIRKELSLENNDYRTFKRICVHNHKPSRSGINFVAKHTHMQKIDDLKLIINHKKLTKEKFMTFCKDEFDQVLYIYQTDLASISIIFLRDQHTEECYSF
jgi:hypothetical protein